MALPWFMSTMGIEHYTLPSNPGFHGVIKTFPEDFIVTELSTDGRPVVLDKFDLPPLPALAKPPPEEAKVARPHPTTTPPLTSLISSEQYQVLSAAAATYASTADPAAVPRTNLGAFPDKHARAPVHIAVRLAFPVLQTSTTRNQEGESEIWVLPDPKYVQLRELLGHEEAERLLVFLSTSDHSERTVHLLLPDGSKERRTKVHQLLTELYGQLVETKTYVARPSKRAKLSAGQGSLSGEQLPQISVRFRNQTWGHSRKRQDVGGDAPDLCTQFVLRKKNLEMLEAIQKLSSALDSHPSQFGFAGNKDRRAVTLQRMTVRGISADRFHAIADHPLMSNLTTGNYSYVSRPLRLGELGGNHFRITIRNVRAKDPSQDLRSTVSAAMREVEERGLVNYFGPQRFGWAMVHSALTGPQIGLAMLQRDHKLAVDTFLGAQENETNSRTQEAKRYFEQTHDAAGTLERMPHHNVREKLILKALHHHGYNKYGCTSALMSIPYSSRLLHIHSFTSLIWNHTASFRIKQYGMEAVEGDLVLQEVQSQSSAKPTWKEMIHVLTSEDVHSGRYSIRDVVLPSLGIDTVLPSNKVSDWLQELLPLAGITLGSFRLRGLGMRAPGIYRKLVAYPRHLQWRWLERSTTAHMRREQPAICRAARVVESHPCPQPQPCDVPATLQPQTDSVSLSTTGESSKQEAGKPSDDGKAEREEDGGAVLEVSFELESSCYATVLLRELMRSEDT